MSSVSNLFRDQFHVDQKATLLTFPTAVLKSGGSVSMNSDGVVYTTKAMARALGTVVNTGSGYWYSVGLMMKPPIVDDTPYRVKATWHASTQQQYLIIGYAPAAPTGSGDLITQIVAKPIQRCNEVDEVFLIKGLAEGDPDFGKPMAFAIAFASTTSGDLGEMTISVQNLAQTAPKFAASIS